ncbi:hypothetical protein [Acinetobacter phage vB_AbaS_TCUP2199]|nr:hypothetical protein [Acinetobacter phage vB_AbaS_TCUP2199]
MLNRVAAETAATVKNMVGIFPVPIKYIKHKQYIKHGLSHLKNCETKMKTIHQLVADQEKLSQKIREHQNEIRILQEGIIAICDEIKDRFAPKDILGHLFKIKGYTYEVGYDEESRNYDALEERIFRVKSWGQGYKKIMEGRLCKVIAVDLMNIMPDKKEIRWMITAIPANADGKFGNLIIRTNVIDKVSLSD